MREMLLNKTALQQHRAGLVSTGFRAEYVHTRTERMSTHEMILSKSVLQQQTPGKLPEVSFRAESDDT